MKRRLGRELAVQCLYQIEMNHVSVQEAIDMVFQEAKEDNEAGVDLQDEAALRKYTYEIVAETSSRSAVLDEALSHYLTGWKMDRLSRVDRQILRLALYEMVVRDDVPPKAAVNEAIELAKHFGFEESGKFVNGVLGKMIKDLDTVKDKVHAAKE